MSGQQPGSLNGGHYHHQVTSHLYQNHLDIAQHSEPASELDADADADEDMAYIGTPSPYPPASNASLNTVNHSRNGVGDKIDLQAVDPVLYGLRRSVRRSLSPFARMLTWFHLITGRGTVQRVEVVRL